MKKHRPIKQRGRKPSKALQMKQQDAHLEKELNKNHNREKRKLQVIQGGKSPKKMVGKLIWIAAICVVAVAVIIINSAAPTGIVELVKVSMARSAGGSGYPVTISGSVPKYMVNQGGRLSVLTDTGLIEFNDSGREVYNRLHGFANPVMKTSAVRSLIFDRGGIHYRIETSAETVYDGKTEQDIITADICDNGTYAIANEDDNNVCVVTVYNKSNTPFYRYNSSKYYVTDVKLSKDGRKMAVATLTSENAEFKSTVLIYDLTKESPIAKQEFVGETVVSMNFENENNVTVLTGKRWASISVSDNKLTEYSFGTDRLLQYYTTENLKTVLCLSSNLSSADVRVVVINAKGKQENQFSFSGNINSVCMTDDRIYILSSELHTYALNGEKIQTDITEVGSLCVAPINDSAAVLYASGIVLYSEK
ncbi:MAG: hypothetical protein IJF54_03775 [Clostridia bacterium]|nr:hypothetical protein [Clostridia bacterium]